MKRTLELNAVTPQTQLPPYAGGQSQQRIQTASSNQAYAQNTLNSISCYEFHRIEEPLLNYCIELNTHEGYNILLNIMQLNRWYLSSVGALISSPIITQHKSFTQHSSSAETLPEWMQALKNNNLDLLLNYFSYKLFQKTLIQYFHVKRNADIPAYSLFANVFESHLELLKSLVRTAGDNFFQSINTGKFLCISLDKDARKVLTFNFYSPCSSYILAHLLKDIIVSLINCRKPLSLLPIGYVSDSKVNRLLIHFLEKNAFFDLGSDILHSYLDYLWLNLLSQAKRDSLVFAFEGFVNLIKNKIIDQSNFQLVEFVEYTIEGMIYCGGDEDHVLEKGFEFLIVKFPELKSVITKRIIQGLADNIEYLYLGNLYDVLEHLSRKHLIDQASAIELQFVQIFTKILSNAIQVWEIGEQVNAVCVLDTLAKNDLFDKSLINAQFVETVTSIDFFSDKYCLNVKDLFDSLIEKSMITKFELTTYLIEYFSLSSSRVKANILWLFSGEEDSFMDKRLINQFSQKFLKSIADYRFNFQYEEEPEKDYFVCEATQFITTIVDNNWIDQSSVADMQLVEKLLALLTSDAFGLAWLWLSKLLDNDLIDQSWVVEKPELVQKIITHFFDESVSSKGILLFAEMVRKCFKRSDNFLDDVSP